MTREEAAKLLRWIYVSEHGEVNCRTWYNCIGNDIKEALDMAINTLEQEPCEDAISRQAVFEQINCWIGSGEYRYTNATDYLNKRIKALQAVNPQEPCDTCKHYENGCHWLPSINPQEPLTEEDYIELRDRFGDYVVFVVRDMVSGKDERWKKRSDKA